MPHHGHVTLLLLEAHEMVHKAVHLCISTWATFMCMSEAALASYAKNVLKPANVFCITQSQVYAGREGRVGQKG